MYKYILYQNNLLKQDESSFSLGNNAVNMGKHTPQKKKLWKKCNKVMWAKIPHCF